MSTNEKKKRSFKLPTAYTVLLAITAIIAIATYFIPGVKKASLADFVMAPITGLQEAIDIAIFVLLIGGFLGVTTKTGALDAGIGNVVAKLKGKELILIPVLMFIFSLGGTSFGMAEETIAFTALVTTTMIIAGFDPLVSVASIILGAGCGVLGSTVNPFLVSVSIGALKGQLSPLAWVRASVCKNYHQFFINNPSLLQKFKIFFSKWLLFLICLFSLCLFINIYASCQNKKIYKLWELNDKSRKFRRKVL